MPLSARAQFTPRGDLGQFVKVRITPGVIASCKASADLVRDEAKALAPVDTGALRDSIVSDVRETDKSAVGTVTVGVPYGPYVEFGTGRRGAESANAGSGPYNLDWPGMVPQPFMRPAVEVSRSAILDLFRSNISLSL